jgi:RNA recognition motif-containing protein
MTKCLYIGNLPPECSEDDLRSLFAAWSGSVEKVTIALDRRTGKSRGFGFVDMASDDEATTALESLKGTELGGRALKFGPAFTGKRQDMAASSSYEDYGHSDRPRRRRGRGSR